jgi:hypothetical protein
LRQWGENRGACKLLVRKPEEKRPLGRPSCRCMDNIKMDLGKIGWDGMDFIHMVQDGDQWRGRVNMVIKF